MTEDQFEKFLAVQIAQLAMLQGIYNSVQVAASATGKAAGHNWKDIENHIKNAQTLVGQMK